mmetsp:Transcript_7337/g.22318  ORF Transcript_7337/g.22318 Transcript_7337/m.22318 type:complete len:283 (-) Transcript_7337:674-1522(-)
MSLDGARIRQFLSMTDSSTRLCCAAPPESRQPAVPTSSSAYAGLDSSRSCMGTPPGTHAAEARRSRAGLPLLPTPTSFPSIDSGTLLGTPSPPPPSLPPAWSRPSSPPLPSLMAASACSVRHSGVGLSAPAATPLPPFPPVKLLRRMSACAPVRPYIGSDRSIEKLGRRSASTQRQSARSCPVSASATPSSSFSSGQEARLSGFGALRCALTTARIATRSASCSITSLGSRPTCNEMLSSASATLPPSNSGRPRSISPTKHPNAHTSAAGPGGMPAMTSGAS